MDIRALILALFATLVGSQALADNSRFHAVDFDDRDTGSIHSIHLRFPKCESNTQTGSNVDAEIRLHVEGSASSVIEKFPRRYTRLVESIRDRHENLLCLHKNHVVTLDVYEQETLQERLSFRFVEGRSGQNDRLVRSGISETSGLTPLREPGDPVPPVAVMQSVFERLYRDPFGTIGPLSNAYKDVWLGTATSISLERMAEIERHIDLYNLAAAHNIAPYSVALDALALRGFVLVDQSIAQTQIVLPNRRAIEEIILPVLTIQHFSGSEESIIRQLGPLIPDALIASSALDCGAARCTASGGEFWYRFLLETDPVCEELSEVRATCSFDYRLVVGLSDELLLTPRGLAASNALRREVRNDPNNSASAKASFVLVDGKWRLSPGSFASETARMAAFRPIKGLDTTSLTQALQDSLPFNCTRGAALLAVPEAWMLSLMSDFSFEAPYCTQNWRHIGVLEGRVSYSVGSVLDLNCSQVENEALCDMRIRGNCTYSSESGQGSFLRPICDLYRITGVSARVLLLPHESGGWRIDQIIFGGSQ